MGTTLMKRIVMENISGEIFEEIFSLYDVDIAEAEKSMSKRVIASGPVSSETFKNEEHLGELNAFEKMVLALLCKRKKEQEEINLPESENIAFEKDIKALKTILFTSIDCRIKTKNPTVYIKEGFNVFSSPYILKGEIAKSNQTFFEKV